MPIETIPARSKAAAALKSDTPNPSTAALPSPPKITGARYTNNSSIRSDFKNSVLNIPPPSTNTLFIPLAARNYSVSISETLPDLLPVNVTTCKPKLSICFFLLFSAAPVVNMIVLYSVAVETI